MSDSVKDTSYQDFTLICLRKNLIKEPVKVGNIGLDLGGVVEHDGVVHHGGVIVWVESNIEPTANNIIRTFNTLKCEN